MSSTVTARRLPTGLTGTWPRVSVLLGAYANVNNRKLTDQRLGVAAATFSVSRLQVARRPLVRLDNRVADGGAVFARGTCCPDRTPFRRTTYLSVVGQRQ